MLKLTLYLIRRPIRSRESLILESPWQNSYIERLIGAVRRDCLDYVILLNEQHLHLVLPEYVGYYNESQTHLGLEKQCPVPRAVEPPEIGPIRKSLVLRGLHHRYFREAA